MREKIIEQQLVHAVKHKGGICPKFVSPGYDGMPDRLVLLPHGALPLWSLKPPERKCDRCRYIGSAVRSTWLSGILHRQ